MVLCVPDQCHCSYTEIVAAEASSPPLQSKADSIESAFSRQYESEFPAEIQEGCSSV